MGRMEDWFPRKRAIRATVLTDFLDRVGERTHAVVGTHLIAYDAQHNTNLVDTLRAWLEAFGDVVAPEARFAAMLELRIVATPAPPPGK